MTMSHVELARRLEKLNSWAEDVAAFGDVDPQGNARYVDSQTLLEEVQAQMERLAQEAIGHPVEPRVPLIYRAAELEEES